MRPIFIAIAAAATLLASPGCSRPGPATPSPSATAPATIQPTSGPPVPIQSLAVYYALDRPGRGPRLVREFHPATTAVDPAVQVRAAVTEMLTRKAFDPDYRNLWPAGATVLNVSVAADTATIDFAGAATANLGAEASAIALQQLVWTVTAVPNVHAVKIMLDGRPTAELWGHLDVGQPQRRSAAADVLYPVWLISPQHGDQVGRQVTLHIAGIAFEATVNYEITRAGAVVKEGFVTLSAGPPLQGEAKQAITLDQPGAYVIAAYLISAKDGSREAIDDHTVTAA